MQAFRILAADGRRGMIDLHSHILPGFDDGAASPDESVAMLRIAAGSGTTDIVATPHSNLEYGFDRERAREAIANLVLAGGPAPRIHCGCDFHLSYDNVRAALAEPSRYTINQKNYLLVEFPDLLISRSIDDIFGRFLDAGIVPVITHPERNALLQRRIGQLASWVEDGCAVQVTAQSFLGRFGTEAREFCRELMRRDLVHFVASDAHDPQDRTPRLDLAYQHVAEHYGEPRARRLFITNPQAALSGEPLDTEPEPQPVRERKWYRFWNIGR
jgi:protein-tyrosine phosphatase